MKLSRRDALKVSGTAVAGFSVGGGWPRSLAGEEAQQEPWPEGLVEGDLRDRVFLPLNTDGSAPEHPTPDADGIRGVIWRYTNGAPPDIDYDYRNLQVRLDPAGFARLRGTVRFGDLERLPRVSETTLLQCGVPEPTGVVKWTGVRFADFAEMIGVQPAAHYCRVISHDGYYIDEEMATMRHPQVLLAWLLNDGPIPPINGAPLRLVIPFRYGARSIKAVSEITFGSPGLPMREVPTRRS